MIEQTLQTTRSAVKAKGWTPAELARKAGVSWATVANMESEDWSPTVKTLRNIERAIEGKAPVKSPRTRKPHTSHGAHA